MKLRNLFIRRLSLLLIIHSGIIFIPWQVFAQDEKFPNFDQVDLIVAKDISKFSNLFAEGRKRVVRLALLGDSQETAPGGGGMVYMPRLNFELGQYFGNNDFRVT